jgi:hypothetical protein
MHKTQRTCDVQVPHGAAVVRARAVNVVTEPIDVVYNAQCHLHHD